MLQWTKSSCLHNGTGSLLQLPAFSVVEIFGTAFRWSRGCSFVSQFWFYGDIDHTALSLSKVRFTWFGSPGRSV
jgi:hypothetical protein